MSSIFQQLDNFLNDPYEIVRKKGKLYIQSSAGFGSIAVDELLIKTTSIFEQHRFCLTTSSDSCHICNTYERLYPSIMDIFKKVDAAEKSTNEQLNFFAKIINNFLKLFFWKNTESWESLSMRCLNKPEILRLFNTGPSPSTLTYNFSDPFWSE